MNQQAQEPAGSVKLPDEDTTKVEMLPFTFDEDEPEADADSEAELEPKAEPESPPLPQSTPKTTTPPPNRPTHTQPRSQPSHQPDEHILLDPNNIEAEEGLIACCLVDSDLNAMSYCLARGIKPESFYKTSHQTLYGAMKELHDQGDPLDEIILLDYLRDRGLEDDVGGIAAIYAIQNRVETPAHAKRFTRIVAKNAARRQAIRLGREFTEKLQHGATAHDAIEYLIPVANDLANLSRGNTADTPEMSPKARKLLDQMIGKQEQLWSGEIPEAVPDLVILPNGKGLFYRYELNEIHGEPGRGKTWIVLVAAVHVLAEGGRVLILDPESSAKKIIRRLRILGCTNGAGNIIHMNPTSSEEWEAAHAFALHEFKPTLVIIDGVASYIQANGGTEDIAADCLHFLKTRCNPFKAIAGVLLTDHVTKSKDNQGRYSRGSGAKLGEYKGAVYELKTDRNLSPKNGGTIRFIVAKDNEGGVGANGETAAVLKFSPMKDQQTTAKFYTPEEVPEIQKPKRMSTVDAKAHGRVLAQRHAWKLADWIQAVQRDSGRSANNLIAELKEYALAADDVVIDTTVCGKSQPKLIGPRQLVSELKLKLESEYQQSRQQSISVPS